MDLREGLDEDYDEEELPLPDDQAVNEAPAQGVATRSLVKEPQLRDRTLVRPARYQVNFAKVVPETYQEAITGPVALE